MGKTMVTCASLFVALALLAAIAVDTTNINNIFNKKLITRFCYTSPNTAQVLSQCVYCDYYAFPSTTLACTGTTALTNNVTTTQALCIINSCFAQYPQGTQFAAGAIGRKRRDVDTPPAAVISVNTERPEPEVTSGETVILNRAGDTVPKKYLVVQEIHAFLELDSEPDQETVE